MIIIREGWMVTMSALFSYGNPSVYSVDFQMLYGTFLRRLLLYYMVNFVDRGKSNLHCKKQ